MNLLTGFHNITLGTSLEYPVIYCVTIYNKPTSMTVTYLKDSNVPLQLNLNPHIMSSESKISLV